MGDQRKKGVFSVGKTTLGLRPDPTSVVGPNQDSCRRASSRCEVPELCSLDGFARVVERNGGVDLSRLEPLTCLAVETDTAVYAVTLINPSEAEVLIRGGEIFAQPFRVKLSGATVGGSFLKTRWIGLGMQMEICCLDGTFITTPVRSVKIEQPSDLPGPF